MTESVAIKAILAHDVEVGKSVTVKGWVRSRRTSKGGFAFIHIHDGSCFDTIQAVADKRFTTTKRSTNSARDALLLCKAS